MSNALSRLINSSTEEQGTIIAEEGILDKVFAFNKFLIGISSEFKK